MRFSSKCRASFAHRCGREFSVPGSFEVPSEMGGRLCKWGAWCPFGHPGSGGSRHPPRGRYTHPQIPRGAPHGSLGLIRVRSSVETPYRCILWTPPHPPLAPSAGPAPARSRSPHRRSGHQRRHPLRSRLSYNHTSRAANPQSAPRATKKIRFSHFLA